ncbi:glyoxylate/hydroxypyruvate reductase A-like [Littorina saxatilis]|uniref:glyoxylate/hydroxypyruvate reductase A-like n=1 Tax=Littorina saxatilis TaxID=31220 RepID=UPI0038B523FE
MYHDQQKASVWKRIGGDSPRRCLVLRDSSVVLLGVGNIGKRMASLCNMFGMTVYGVTRTPVEKGHGSPDVHHYSTTEDLPSTLSQGDYIVNMLPSTEHTRGLLDHDVLQVCKDKKPVFINVGRGDIMGEESIIKALRSEWISGAILDVFPVEPLPADSLLWKEPGVTITPHIAMALDEDTLQKAVAVFLENYNRFVSKKDLIDVVDIERGY